MDLFLAVSFRGMMGRKTYHFDIHGQCFDYKGLQDVILGTIVIKINESGEDYGKVMWSKGIAQKLGIDYIISGESCYKDALEQIKNLEELLSK